MVIDAVGRPETYEQAFNARDLAGTVVLVGVPTPEMRLELPLLEVFGRGGAVIVEPTWGSVIAGPLYDEEGILYADCDLRHGLHAKRWFDAVGHYSRAEVLSRGAAGSGVASSPVGLGAPTGDGALP